MTAAVSRAASGYGAYGNQYSRINQYTANRSQGENVTFWKQNSGSDQAADAADKGLSLEKSSESAGQRARNENIRTVAQAKMEGFSQSEIKQLQNNGTLECQTCSSRKYQDGSDEMVSYKSATHISPEAAASAVKAHEQEHVSNAYEKAEKNDGEVLSVNVSIKTAQCPECGRTYVSGGETTSTIKYNTQSSGSDDSTLGRYVDLYA